MDASRFDAWTRRRVGLALGGSCLTLLGLAGSPDADAGHRHRCRKVRRTCKHNRDCCGSLHCAKAGFPGRLRCCRKVDEPCSGDPDCCGELACGPDDTCVIPSSDRDLKANFATVDPGDVLERVRALPISTWNYRADDPAVRHVGPMAQDFAAVFGVGADDRHIHPIDGQGVALAAVQGLAAELDRLRAENAALAARLAALEQARQA